MIKAPKVVKNLAWGLPFGWVAYDIHGVIIGLLVGLACAGLKGLGHGQYMSLGTVWKPISPERVDFIVRLWFGIDPRTVSPLGERVDLYERCLAGLAVVGLAAVLPCVIALSFANPLAAFILAIGGMSKAIAYAIGWEVYPDGQGKGVKELNQATQIGEFLTGLFAGLTLLIAWGMV